jgi:ribulose-5-phosphate 4-epimerase/fuculose-1-phosphate aldolase
MTATISLTRLKRDVAACTRMLVDQGILNYSGHISVRIPGTEHFLIQRFDDVRTTLDPERLLVVDMDGRVVEGGGRPPLEIYIHSEILRARGDVGAVAHFHHDPTTVFSLVRDRPMVPMKNHASRWADGVGVHPDPSHIDDPAKGREVVATLGSDHALLLRGHGQVLVAEDVRALHTDSVHFVENAATLSLATQLGTVEPLTDAEQQAFLADFDRGKHVKKLWRYYAEAAAASGVLPREWLDGD